MTHLLIVGGSDAGISAALRAREVDPGAEVTVLVADEFPNYSICGLPFFLSGETPDWRQLAHRTAADLEATGMRLLLRHSAQAIEPRIKQVAVLPAGRLLEPMAYDRLIIATGATPTRPPIAGLDLPGVYLLHTMADSFALHECLSKQKPLRAAIVGGGYIGLEMADALTRRGIEVTLVQRPTSLLTTVDSVFAENVQGELEAHGVHIVTGMQVDGIEAAGASLTLTGSSGEKIGTDVVLVATGVRPSTWVAETADTALGVHDAIHVDREMRTTMPDIFAAGDCVETWHRVLEAPIYLPLGTTSHKQGRVAGENAVGGSRQFAGSLGTQVVKVFDLAIARTGLLEGEARAAGFNPFTVETRASDHKAYYPGAHQLRIRVTGDRSNGRLLGAQILGDYRGEVAKRIDIFASALFHNVLVDDLSDLDLSYTPPLGSPWDAVQVAAQAWGVQAGMRA